MILVLNQVIMIKCSNGHNLRFNKSSAGMNGLKTAAHQMIEMVDFFDNVNTAVLNDKYWIFYNIHP